MTNAFFIGFDTSNYTTSAAICNIEGEIVKNIKIPLEVKAGERGLRQGDALFSHVKAMPEIASLLRSAMSDISDIVQDKAEIKAVGCSVRPRDSEGSYMPCFLPGFAVGEIAGAVLNVPVYQISHQCGHVAAAVYGACAQKLFDEKFLAFHVSGGTTDLLICEPDDKAVLKITCIGGTSDLNAGQLIDRCGVRMGLRFPAGPEMEKLAKSFSLKGLSLTKRMRVSVNGCNCNFSGAENAAADIYEKTGDREQTAAFVIDFIGRTLEAVRDAAFEKYGRLPVLYSGGVMSCHAFSERLAGENSYFSAPEFSSDNAAGAAIIARRMYLFHNGRK